MGGSINTHGHKQTVYGIKDMEVVTTGVHFVNDAFVLTQPKCIMQQ